MGKENAIKRIMVILFWVYFIVLLAERITSLVLSIVNDVQIWKNGFYIFAYATTILSIVAFIIYILINNKLFIKLFRFKEDILDEDLKKFVISSGIILVSGMIHTEYTNLAIQFVSYAFLIGAIILKGILLHSKTCNKIQLWLSIIYLLCYSMAIPVCYMVSLKYDTLFYITQGITMLVLVYAFTYLLDKLFQGSSDLFMLWPIAIATVLDLAVIGIRFQETINYFLIIFLSLSTLFYVVGIFYRYYIKIQDKN